MRLLMANDQSSQRNASDATCIDRCLDRAFDFCSFADGGV